jgi:tight adherence protein B
MSYPAGLLTTNPFQLRPVSVGPPEEPGWASRELVLYGSIALAFVAVAAGVWVIGSLYAGSQNTLETVLARYVAQGEELPPAEVQEALVQTALMRRAVDLTESLAERQGFLDKVERMLERANLPIRPGEALFFMAAATVVGFAGAFVATQSLLVALVVGLIVVGAAIFGLQFAAQRRLREFETQLPDALQLLAGTLRAGYSLPQGLDSVSNEMADPMGLELRRAITETQLGRELDQALANMADRLQSDDFAWVVMAIGIQREVGGNLAEVLLTVADTMIQRERLHREVSALTAEGRVSAAILALMPPGLGVAMYVMNPAYIARLFDNNIGLILVSLGAVSAVIGLFWMKKVVTIDV